MVKIVIFGQNCEILSKLLNLVKIVKLDKNCFILCCRYCEKLYVASGRLFVSSGRLSLGSWRLLSVVGGYLSGWINQVGG